MTRRSRKTSSAPRVLVADDDPAMRGILRRALTHFGFEADLVESGALVLSKAAPGAYRLFILDHPMKGLTGLDTLLELRKRGLRAPVILMSSNFPGPVLERLAEVAGTGLLYKPFTLEMLRQEIHRRIRI